MEIQTITFERWMCRICLNKGNYSIFEDQLALQQPSSAHQGHHQLNSPSSDSVSIVDALNYFSEFKISQTEIVNEPMMLCESCFTELLQCYKFRLKLYEAECLLKREVAPHDTYEEEGKTGITLHMVDIEPFADADDIDETVGTVQVELNSLPDPMKQAKVHHAKPRFQLTNQVSNILRHVASSSTVNSSYREKRKEPEHVLETSTPTKIQKLESLGNELEKTLIVPKYIFTSDNDNAQEKTVLVVEKAAVSTSCHIPSEKDVDRTDSDSGIFYCKHCPKAFSAPYHLLTHTKNTHLCQHCLKHFPTTLARNQHIREEHKSFKCSLCSFHTQYATNLRAHLRKTHSVNLPAHVSILQSQEPTGNK